MNLIEKIMANKAGVNTVTAGDEITVTVDLTLSHDVTGPLAISQFDRIGVNRVFDVNKVVFIVDHNIPASTVEARRQHRILEEFCSRTGAQLFNRSEGVIHQVAFEKGLYSEGDIVVGADSHTCTAGALGALAIPVGSTDLAAVIALGSIDLEVPEVDAIIIDGPLAPGLSGKDLVLYLLAKFGTDSFTDRGIIFSGDTIMSLPLDDRLTICNMAIEMGAMTGLIAERESVGKVKRVYNFDAGDIEAMIACPSSPGNVKPVSEMDGTALSQVVVGSCTNGRFSDLKLVAEILKGRKIHKNLNMVIVPASKKIAGQMDDAGITAILRTAGAIIGNPGCGPCFGSHQGLVCENDVVLSTTNRNFPGRMGHKDAHVYLASPRVAAESAVMGCITRPGTVLPLEESSNG